MKRFQLGLVAIIAAVFCLTTGFITTDAQARAGGGRSVGSRGIRSYSQPTAPYSQPARSQAAPQQTPTVPSPYQPQPAGGGLFRGMAGGIMGGMLGGMLFRSLGFGGPGVGGGGIGLFEILLIAGIGFMIFRMIGRRREVAAPASYGQGGQQVYAPNGGEYGQSFQQVPSDVDAGLVHIRQMDGSFDECRFNDGVMDIFFTIQGAWMNRDLSTAAPLLTGEMQRILQGDIDRLLQEKRVNRLENIAVRNVEIVEAWQETGQDYLTVLIYANLLDFTTDDATGQVVAGSRTEPVKFEEYWTFTRPVGNNPWKLSAITQK
jgi:predicted lipid-binding transport protein (Tim44 family)